MEANREDMLKTLFEMQKKLNDHTFQKYRICDQGSSDILTSARLLEAGREEGLGPSSVTNKWLTNYLKADNDESRELGEELLWKWWSKDTLDMQNIRVEIVDKLHFLISLSIGAGMDAEDIFDIYTKKNAVNIERLNNNYSKATKDENDNLHITMD